MYGHTADICKICTNCGDNTHSAKDCKERKKCNLCLELGHLYATCPQRKRTFKTTAETVGGEVGGADLVEEGKTVSAETVGGEVGVADLVEEGKTVSAEVEQVFAIPFEDVFSGGLGSGEGPSQETEEMEEEVVVKKKTTKKRSQPAQEKVPTKGTTLFDYWKDKSDVEIKDFYASWPEEQKRAFKKRTDLERISEKEVKKKILDFIKKWK